MSVFERESVTLTRARELYDDARSMKIGNYAEEGVDGSLPMMLVAYRGEREVARVWLQGERQNVLDALRGVAGGFTPDAIGLVIEAWAVHSEPGADRATAEINPDTGRKWDARTHDMSAYVEQHGRGGLVRESITAHVLSAGGDLAVCSGTFVPDGDVLRWDEPQSEVGDDDAPDSGLRARGVLYDAMRRGVRAAGRTSVFRSMIGETFGVSQVEITARTDALAAQSLEGAGVAAAVMLTAGDDEIERREVIARVLGRPWSKTPGDALDDERGRGWGA